MMMLTLAAGDFFFGVENDTSIISCSGLVERSALRVVAEVRVWGLGFGVWSLGLGVESWG